MAGSVPGRFSRRDTPSHGGGAAPAEDELDDAWADYVGLSKGGKAAVRWADEADDNDEGFQVVKGKRSKGSMKSGKGRGAAESKGAGGDLRYSDKRVSAWGAVWPSMADMRAFEDKVRRGEVPIPRNWTSKGKPASYMTIGDWNAYSDRRAHEERHGGGGGAMSRS